MKPRARRRIVLGLVVVTLAVLGGSAALRARSPLEALRGWGRSRGLVVEARSVERGWFVDTLRGVQATLAGGAVVRAAEAELTRFPFATPSLRVPALRVTLGGEPTAAVSQLGELAAPEDLALRISRVSLDYRHPAVGSLVLDGVTGRSGPTPRSVRVESLRLGRARWENVALSVSTNRGAVEVLLGSDATSFPRATALFVPSDGRGSEWRINVPNQPLAPLRTAVGLGAASPEDARIGGNLSWIIPDDPVLPPRGSARFVIDRWYQPPWKEATALIGSSGAIALAFLPSGSSDSIRLARVVVAAGLFDLKGEGTLTLGETPRVELTATGRRTCGRLAVSLPPSSHRRAVRDFLGLSQVVDESAATGPAPEAGRAAETVELALRLELTFGPSGFVRFHWRLGAGCGLGELESG